ncbi:MAG: beta-lactamase family protein, partial [Clostridiaceae bacterium]|nr:beta-lactamase family protein [Clostridiaceae bacterium]
MATKKTTASEAAPSDRKQRTEHLDAVLEKLVSSGFTAGISAYVERGGKPLYRGMTGLADIASGRRITDDTIFRIFSMSKVFTVTGALILYERGLYRMYDPISRFIPAFKNPKVFENGPDGKPYARPATREILVRDLFTMTSGIPYGGADSETERRIGRAMAREERTIAAGGTPSDTLRVAEKLAAIPL